VVAELSAPELGELGLPRALLYSLEIDAAGLVTDPGCQFSYRFWHPGGFPLDCRDRCGCVVEVGDEPFTLSEPYFSLIEGMDAFNQLDAGDLDSRMRIWGQLSERVPEDAHVNNYVRSTRIAFATCFSLIPYLNDDGEPDFVPVAGHMRETADPISRESEDPSFDPSLPEARQEDFGRRFTAFRDAKARYAVGGGWFLVLGEPVQRALAVVRQMKERSPEERRAFVLNPNVFLREELRDLPEAQLDALFYDEGYSERVEGIGLRPQRVLPWVKQAAEPWLPPEQIGVRVGDTFVQVDANDVRELESQLEEAIAAGEPYVEYGGQRIPATPEAKAAIAQLVGHIHPKPEGEPSPKAAASEPIVLLVKENFEVVDYARPERRTRGAIGSLPFGVPPELPFPHQHDALEWLQEHWRRGSPGALLADDMGLGKTLAALLFLAWIRDQMDHGYHQRLPFVTVAPTGLIDNWVSECANHLDEDALGDTRIARGRELRQLRVSRGSELEGGLPVLATDKMERAGWVLTTYETWRDYQHSFARVHWAAAVFDEVQKVKNPAAGVTEAAKAVKSDFTLALTGTPVENRLADLWCIVDLIQPGRLGALKEFSREYERGNGAPEKLAELRTSLTGGVPSIMLRRLKEDHVSGLTEKREKRIRLPMPKTQADAYSRAVERARQGGGRGHMLKTLGDLRSISLHPGLSRDDSDDQVIEASARLSKAFEILDQVQRAGEKVLVFLESREIQGVLVELLQRRFDLPGRPLIINGQVSGTKRKARVDEFQARKGFDAMLISPKAGGVGLTVTAANHVIHLSRWWNPAVEDQCTDRAYRIGQKRDVTVYYPIAVHPDFGDHSFDIRLDELLARKRTLSHGLLAPPKTSRAELEKLFEDTTAERAGVTLADIAIMDPVEFEHWVLSELRAAGYAVDTTPTTRDAGADGIARPLAGSDKPTLIIQCKHTQRERACGSKAVEEVMAASPRYELAGEVVAVVITNAPAFTSSAKAQARDAAVTLIARPALTTLSSWAAQLGR
jgi:superfamily II DNA or RNA helicase